MSLFPISVFSILQTSKVFAFIFQDKDLIEASNHISELSTKLKRLDVQYKECVRSDTESRRQLADWKQKHADARKDIDRLNGKIL